MFNSNQDCRSVSNIDLINNPNGIIEDVKPTRIIVEDTSGAPPANNDPKYQNLWYVIDSSTGNLYYKENGIFTLKYNFTTGGSGINGAVNVGGGNVEIFKQIGGGGVLQFRTIESTGPPSKPFDRALRIDTSDPEKYNITTTRGINIVQNADLINFSLVKDTQYDGDNLGTLLLKTLKYDDNTPQGSAFQPVIIEDNNDNLELKINKTINNIVNEDPGNNNILASITESNDGNNTRVARLRGIEAGQNITITETGTNLRIAASGGGASSFVSCILRDSTAFSVPTSFANIPRLFDTPLLISTLDWSKLDINGSSYFRYDGAVGSTYVFSYDIYAQVTAAPTTPANFTIAIAEGAPAATALGGSGAKLYYNDLMGDSSSGSYIFQPVTNGFYTLQMETDTIAKNISITELRVSIYKI